MRPVIFDMDLDKGDALALCFAIRSTELDILGVSVVAGAVPAETGSQGALQLLELLQRTDIPVYVGSGSAPCEAADAPVSCDALPALIHAPDPETLPAGESSDLLIDSIESRPGDVVVICTGPVTNLAVAESRCPGVLRRARRIFVAGDVSGAGRKGGAASDFNASADPKAFARMLRSGANITLVPQAVGAALGLPSAQILSIPVETNPVVDLVRGWVSADADEEISLHEVLTVALAVFPELCGLETVSAGGQRGTGAEAAVAETVQVERAVNVDGQRVRELVDRRLLSALGVD